MLANHRTTMHPPENPQQSERKKLTVLLGDDQFGELVGDLIERDFGDRYEFRFLKFGSEAELRRLALAERPDLIFLYVSSISWNPRPPGPPPQGCSKAPFACWVYTLGEISARFGVPIIATQGCDLRADADRAGISFFQAPFTVAEITSAVRAALGIQLPPDPASE